jgi:hypothetical protein
MFANIWWSVLVLAGLLGLYIVARVKHGAPLLANNDHIRSFGQRWWARLVAFRSYVAIQVAGVLIAAPDLLVSVAPINLAPLIGEGWAAKVATGLGIFLAVNSVLKVKPTA